ncbi:MAG: RNA polymerase sigma-70 factor [Tannerellaceae bacterium]|jgi:RNA polymerase sigma-70 factor (ECF subfamily)|nr:RNA polymerase sigma-70 factor [Tannerellaceae bacterium]
MAKHWIHKTDRQALFLLREGDKAAFEVVYRDYSAWVYNFFKSLLHDTLPAEDLTQNVFLKIWERREDIQPDDNFEAYLFTIARNMISKETEKRLMMEHLLNNIRERQKETDDSTEQNIETNSLNEYIDQLVEQLPPERRKIYRMSRVGHLSNKEIARELSISEKTVETQLYRSLRFLKQKLSENVR